MVLGDLVGKCVIVWIDDLLVFAETADQLVKSIDVILQKLDEHGFILNPKKFSLFLTEVRWCSRIFNKDGIGHDPTRIQALRDVLPTTTAADLQQVLCASNRMRAGLIVYSRVPRPLQERLDVALTGTKKTKRATAGVQFELTQEELSGFAATKDLLANSAMLAARLVPLVQSSINHSPVPSLTNQAPIELFTGLPSPSTLDTLFFREGRGA
ncbi:Reverse transcriptase-rnase h-integrase [Phytophthora palmivora]|uniref:Reverse transcriptase-rnase h-integrase n=1 Tax=Phytophthora palmivora TaxID=4796 RepID=A0A2P4YNA2_9STRA|nr:Reverse transcriptase-rnase h-integrase [Phytophthora palmivora]